MPVIETLEGGVQVWIANGPAWYRDPKEGMYWVCQLAAGSKPYVDKDGNHQGGATWYENFTDAKAAALKCIEKNKPVLRSLEDEVAQLRQRVKQLEGQIDLGFVFMPMELTAENGAKAALAGEFSELIELTNPGEPVTINHVIKWSTIKAIYAKAVEHFHGKRYTMAVTVDHVIAIKNVS